MNDYPGLDLAFNDLQQQSNLYKPSSFWASAFTLIREELKSQGIESFRRRN
jgi:hypothetical protein